jgi:hypothetical protein
MFKKLIMSCMAAAAFAAFVLPATAAAVNDPQLTEGINSLPDGTTKLLFTNTGTIDLMDTTGAGTPQISCTKASLTGTLTNNTAGTVEVSLTKAELSGTPSSNHPDTGLPECTASIGNAGITLGLPLTLKSTPTMANDEFQVSGTGAGGTVVFSILSTVAGTCKYQSTSTIKGDYTTAATTVLTVRNTQAGSGMKLVEGGFFCPTSAQLRLSLFIETDVPPYTEIGTS